jgi:iron complex outermembrane receptor protein
MATLKYQASAVSAGIAVALGSSPLAVAQDDGIEEIVVTGSHIRRDEYSGRAPVQIVDQEQFELIGAVQPIEMVKELTVNSGSAYYNETNNGQGISQFNIRNLGLGSTLTLINGKRGGIAAVGDATGTDFVDINQFPLAMIARIEVLPNGASATYGSQAVAGVANIITRKGFEGLEISGGVATSEIDAWHLNLAAGSQFDKGGFNIYATYYEQDRQDRSEFDWLDSRLNGAGIDGRSRFLSGTGSPGSVRRATLNADGQATDVRINNPLFDPGCTVDCASEFLIAPSNRDPDCEAAGGVIGDPADTGLAPNVCRYNFADQVSVIAAEKRAQVFTEFDWEFNDKVSYYMEASFSNNKVLRDTGGQLLATGQATGGGVTVLPSHPFNFYVEDAANPLGLTYIGPENWDPAIHTAATLRSIHRPFGASVTNTALTREQERDITYNRIVNGMEFQLPGDWYLDTSYMWAKSQIVTAEPEGIRSDRYQQLIREGTWNPFGTRISNPGLVSPKGPLDTVNCFNVDFGGCVAGNSSDVQDQWNQRQVSQASAVEKVVDVVAAGDLFEMGGNMVQAAVGAQWRGIEYKNYPDSLSSASEDGGEGFSGAVIGDQEVTAFFAEVVMPMGDIGEIQLAVRNEDYGDGVSTTDPKISAEFGLGQYFGVRGSWGTSFQAPAVRQIGRSTSSQFIDDPASATGPGGSFICNDQQVSNNITTVVQGSPDLVPQEAEKHNLGVVFQTERFRASLDYWLFDYEDLIAPEAGAQAIVDAQCPTNDSSPIVVDQRVIRDATGQVRTVTSQFTNIGAVETSGIDFNADYTMDIGNSSLIFNIAATYVDSFDVDTDGDGVNDFDGAGSRNQSNNFNTMPDVRANSAVVWFAGNHTARLGVNYIGDYTNDQGNDAVINSWTVWDAMYSYTFNGWLGDGDTTLTLGVNNLLDEDPPTLYRNDPNTGERQGRFFTDPAEANFGLYNRGWSDRPGYDDRAGHDLRGQVVYLRFKHLF